MSDRVVRLEPPIEKFDRASFEGLEALAVTASRETQSALSSAFLEIEGVECGFAAPDATPTGALAGATARPDILLFEAADESKAAEWLKALRAAPEGADIDIIVLLPTPTKSGTLRLLREGADDVLSTSPDGVEITRALARANASNASNSPEDVRAEARTLVFLHASGGAGATTFAVNSALLLKQRMEAAAGGVCLIDFDVQFGDAHLHLDLPMNSRVVEVVRSPERLDHRMLEDLMIDGPLGIRVFTAPEAAMPLDGLQPQTVETILSIARRHYRYVIIDMPRALAHWTGTVLRQADHIFLVTQVNVSALRSARRLLDLIQAEKQDGALLTVIANRYGGRRDGANITLAQAAKALGAPIAITAPSDYRALVESLDQGVPAAITQPRAKLCRAASAALDRVLDDGAAPADATFLQKLLSFGR